MKKAGFKNQLKRIKAKSRQTYNTAYNLIEFGDYESAVSRAYYAVFYMLEALLLTKGLSYSKHSAVISAFSKYFIKEGVFPAEFAKKVKKLRKNREIGDYDYYKNISKKGAQKNIKNAKIIINKIEDYLQKAVP